MMMNILPHRNMANTLIIVLRYPWTLQTILWIHIVTILQPSLLKKNDLINNMVYLGTYVPTIDNIPLHTEIYNFISMIVIQSILYDMINIGLLFIMRLHNDCPFQ